MIYATRLSWPRGKYNWLRIPLVIAILTGAVVSAAQLGGRWREAPEYLRLFAPAGPRASRFRMYTTSDSLPTALGSLDVRPGHEHTGMWTAQAVAPIDAFGNAGPYDRFRMARLYGSARPHVARGTVMADGAREFWTLISPYPDAALQRLQPGTLLIVLRYDGRDPGE